jgi:molybdenum cofactor synthesis domain-containing protein
MFTVGILTISDKGFRGEREDRSGEVIREMVSELRASVAKYDIVPDEKDIICQRLKEWSDVVDVVITTGGTGLSQRDVTPEATLAVVDRLAPGFAEAMRAESLKRTPLAMLSRGVCGMRGNTLIINLPGSPNGVRECLEAILPALPHAIEVIKGEAGECADREDLPHAH